MRVREVLQEASFGERIAEQEIGELAEYFVETDQWRRLYAGDVDIVYGPKGAGKSALYSLLVTKQQELFDRGILIVPAENPSGAPAFQDVAADPPTSEPEFIGLWKVYFLGLIAAVLKEWGVETDEAQRVYGALREAGLLEEKASLRTRLHAARNYVKRMARAEAVEGGLVLDPATGMPVGITGKITLGQPSTEERAAGLVSIDDLLAAANEALTALGVKVWLILDNVACLAESCLGDPTPDVRSKKDLDCYLTERLHIQIGLEQGPQSVLLQILAGDERDVQPPGR